MQYTCPNVGCGAVYRIAAKVIGQRFTCKKCGAALVMEEAGLQLAGGGSLAPLPEATDPYGGTPAVPGAAEIPLPPPVVPPPPAVTAPAALGDFAPAMLQRRTGSLQIDLPTWLFGAGAVFVVFFLFLPIIDQMKIARLRGLVDEGNNRIAQMRAELEAKKGNDPEVNRYERTFTPVRPADPFEKVPTDSSDKYKDDEKKIKDEEKDWYKKKVALLGDLDSARVSARRAVYWYSWGMMFGFLLLAVASLGYLMPYQTATRRVTGSIVLCALVLLIFFVSVGGSVVATVEQLSRR